MERNINRFLKTEVVYADYENSGVDSYLKLKDFFINTLFDTVEKNTKCYFITFSEKAINKYLLELLDELNIAYEIKKLKSTSSEKTLLNLIEKLNNDDNISAIWLEFENLPDKFNEFKIFSSINENKDVCGLNPLNRQKAINAKDVKKEGFTSLVNPLIKTLEHMANNYDLGRSFFIESDNEKSNLKIAKFLMDYYIDKPSEISLSIGGSFSDTCYNATSFFIGLSSDLYPFVESGTASIIIDASKLIDSDGNYEPGIKQFQKEIHLCTVRDGRSSFYDLVNLSIVDNIIMCSKLK
ncbi:tetrahydrofolate dehydrogenase/cyclohydrolase catalytic domain-containing protein [Clostridium perfringens]